MAPELTHVSYTSFRAEVKYVYRIALSTTVLV